MGGRARGGAVRLLLWGLVLAALFFAVSAVVGATLIYAWAVGEIVPTAWANGAAWGALANALLPLLIVLGVAIGTEFSFDNFNRVTNEREVPWPRRAWWYAFGICTAVGLLFAALDSEAFVQSLPSPALLTVAFAISFVSSWIALAASVPIVIAARRRWKALPMAEVRSGSP